MPIPLSRNPAALVGVLLLGAWVFLLPPRALADDRYHILLLHSYDPAYAWTRQVDQAISATLGASALAPLVRTVTYYMDTKRHHDAAYLDTVLKSLLVQQLQGQRFDLVLCSDDDALAFVLEHRAGLFASVPIVFCGANFFDVQGVRGYARVTGVREECSVYETLDMALRLHPAARQVVVVGDTRDATSRKSRELLLQEIPALAARAAFIFWEDPLDELLVRAAQLGDESILVLNGVVRDRAGQAIDLVGCMADIRAQSAVPLYEVQRAVFWGGLTAAVGLIMLLAGLFVSTRTKLASARALRRSEDQLTLALEAAHAGIWTVNLRTNEVFLSPQWFSILGYEPEAFPQSTQAWFDLVHPEDGPRAIETYRRFRDDPRTDFAAEFRMRAQSGEWRWILSTGRVSAADAQGKALSLIGIHLDITARKLAEDALAASERLYRDMFNEAPVMYVITRACEGLPIIADANDLFLKKLGYALHEVAGQQLGRFYTEQSRWDLLAGGGYRRALEGHYLDEERRLVTRGGQVLHTLLRSVAEKDEAGRVIGTRAMFLDVTARKQAEEESLRLLAALEQAQKMESIGTLAGGIAHDFNNILAGMLGYAELALADCAPGAPQHTMLEAILHGGQRARDLVRQILTFSRQDRREPKPLELGPVVAEALHLMRSSLPATIEIRQAIADGLGHVMADPTHIHQILMNLCANAAYAMEETGGVLQVDVNRVAVTEDDRRRYPELSAGDYLCLRVVDNGCGMPAHFLKHIFEPYFTTKEKGQGTGLGLAVVHGLVRGYGGTVTVSSAPGQGAAFGIYLPCRLGAGAPPAEVEDRLPGGRERILVVDDEPFVLDIVRQMLTRLGYTVESCANGAQALERFHAAPAAFDLVISDMTMPGLTGDRLAAELARIRPGIPVILCTGFSQRLTAGGSTCPEVKAVLTKPLRYADLAQEVRKALGNADMDPYQGAEEPVNAFPGVKTSSANGAASLWKA